MTDSVAFHTATNPNGVGLFSNDTTVVTLPPLGLRFLVSFTCVFSMLGASLIVLVYSLLPKVRTKPALILVHISLMDFLTAMANLTGVVLVITGNNRGPGCVVQASLAMYGTLSSVLWTSGLAVYVFAAVLFGERKVTRDHVLHCLCVLCYGLPLIMTLWFSLTGKLGPDPIGGPSWCSLVLHDGAGRRLPFNTLFGNDVWMYVTIVMVVVLFAPMHCYLKYSHYDDNDSGLEPLPLLSAELKLIGVPVVFILLRIWSLLLGFVDVEIGYDSDTTATTVLLYMSGIGDSAQGFANALIFLLFTPDVRVTAFRCCRDLWCEERIISPPCERLVVDSTSVMFEESHCSHKSILATN